MSLITLITQEKVTEALQLINSGKFDPNEVDEDNNSPLLLSCWKENEEIALALIKSGKSNPQHKNNDGDTALIYSCGQHMTKVALALIATGQSLPGEVDINGNTALMIACEAVLTDVVLALIATGKSNPSQVNEVNDTALTLACKNGLTDIAIALIKTGLVDPFYYDNTDKSPEDYAVEGKLKNVINEIEKFKDSIFININENGYDIFTRDTTKIIDYLDASNKNICFKIHNQHYLTNIDIILTQTNNPNNIKYGCRIAGDNQYNSDYTTLNGTDYTDDENIDYNMQYFSLGTVLGIPCLVRLSDLMKYYDETSKSISQTLFFLQESSMQLPSIISQDYLNPGSSGSSADHCQTGKKTTVYNIIEAEEREEPVAAESSQSQEPVVNTNKVTINTNSGDKVQIPVNNTTTVGQLKETMLNLLLEKRKIDSTNKSVRFIFMGKIYSDNNQPVTGIPKFSYDMPFTAQISNPKVNVGGKTKKNAKKPKKTKATVKRNNKTKKLKQTKK